MPTQRPSESDASRVAKWIAGNRLASVARAAVTIAAGGAVQIEELTFGELWDLDRESGHRWRAYGEIWPPVREASPSPRPGSTWLTAFVAPKRVVSPRRRLPPHGWPLQVPDDSVALCWGWGLRPGKAIDALLLEMFSYRSPEATAAILHELNAGRLAKMAGYLRCDLKMRAPGGWGPLELKRRAPRAAADNGTLKTATKIIDAMARRARPLRGSLRYEDGQYTDLFRAELRAQSLVELLSPQNADRLAESVSIEGDATRAFERAKKRLHRTILATSAGVVVNDDFSGVDVPYGSGEEVEPLDARGDDSTSCPPFFDAEE
jgi:hypothetical protein